MKSLITNTCLIAGTALMLAQPVLAQTSDTQGDTLRPYSQQELRRAYEQGRADQAKDMARDSGYPVPVRAGREPVGYCYQRQASARATGTIIGAVLGGAIGNGLSNRWNRGGNTIGGALVGGMLGNAVGSDSVQCHQNAYYSYDDGGYYAPPPPPRGYVTVFFSSSPGYGYGYHHYRGHPNYGRHW